MPDTPTKPEPHTERSTGVAASIIIDMTDTTWRMFIPTIGLLMLGRMLDSHFTTKPWLMIGGIVLGSVIAGLLVKRQLARRATN
jgi:hypothetical protein